MSACSTSPTVSAAARRATALRLSPTARHALQPPCRLHTLRWCGTRPYAWPCRSPAPPAAFAAGCAASTLHPAAPFKRARAPRPPPPDLEWKLTYVGSADSEKYDQVLDTVFVGPVAPGQYRFVFQVRQPGARAAGA